jgi:hypothetical protein
VSFCDNLPEVGLHQCPSERKGEGAPVRSLRAPSEVPSQPQNAPKLRGFSRKAWGFTAETDCLLEESGFEPLVPLRSQHNRGIGPISPIASIRIPLVMPLADSISISVASGASDSNPPSSSDSLERTW